MNWENKYYFYSSYQFNQSFELVGDYFEEGELSVVIFWGIQIVLFVKQNEI
jgi:hypothetical protein